MLCECGCGRRVGLARRTDPERGWVKGQPKRFIHGHNRRGRFDPPRYRVEDRGHETPCWIWLGATAVNTRSRSHAYGLMNGGQLAHRVMYEQARGPIPEGHDLDHLCRETLCVNPDHVEPVTHRENCRRGAMTLLTREQVVALHRDFREAGMPVQTFCRDRAPALGVSLYTIRAALSGQSWPDVYEEIVGTVSPAQSWRKVAA